MRSWLALILAITFWFAACALPVLAVEDAVLLNADKEAKSLQAELRRLTTLPRNTSTPEAIQSDRSALAEFRVKARAASDTLAAPLSELTKQLKELGPPPAEGATEAAALADTRAKLNGQVEKLQALGKQFDLLALEAEQAEARLTGIQREQFLQRIFSLERSILDPRLWWDAAVGTATFIEFATQRARTSWALSQSQRQPMALLIFPLGMALLWLLARKLLPAVMNRAAGSVAGTTDPATSLQRLWRAAFRTIQWMAAIVAAVLLAFIALPAAGFLPGIWEDIFDLLVTSVAYALAAGGVFYMICTPGNPQDRLVAIDEQAARALPLLAGGAAFLDGAGESLSELASKLSMPVSFVVSLSAAISLAIIACLAVALATIRRQATKNLAEGNTPYFLVWTLRFMPLLWLLLVTAVIALLFGFVALSYFIASNLLNTALIAVTLGITHALVDAFAKAVADPQSKPGSLFRQMSGWTESAISRLALLMRTLTDVVIVSLAALVLIGMWTDVLFDTSSIFTAARDGFQIGEFSVSPAALAIGFVVLLLGIILTRSVTGWLDRRVLSDTQLDSGARNSIHSGARYAGYALAAVVALTATGLDLSSLTIAAGALGLGIGFGLQSIANNFVSGLILLAERPVRVGDWVATNAGEGIVKKINVRSTEIETFDNCTIIVPNSNLISEAVRNWTHRDTVGRFTVSVSVAHGSDAKSVAKKLLALTQAHPKVMRHPAPTVHLSRITPQSLDFDLRGYTQHVFDAVNISSDLRVSITEELPAKALHLVPPAAPVSRSRP